MLRSNHSQGNRNYYYFLIVILFLLSILCVSAEIYFVNFSQTRWYDIIKTIGKQHLHICVTQKYTVASGCIFLFFFLLFFIYFTRYFENSQYNIAHIFTFSKKKTYSILIFNLIIFITYFCFAFREIRKTTPGNCAKIKGKHDSLYQTWNWNFRENWEKIYDTSFIFYNLVCFHIYQKKVNLLIISTVGIFLLTAALIYYLYSKDNYTLLG